jgi:hypothetical protein
MFVIPEPKTAEARAAAAGSPLNARDIVDRAKRQYAEGSKAWRREWRRQRRQWRRQGWAPGSPFAYAPAPWMGLLLPVFGLVHLALFLVMAAMLVSLVNTGTILDRPLPPDVPVWAAALMLLIGYQIVVSPFRSAQLWSVPAAGAEPGWAAFWNAVIWLAGVAFAVWLASNNLPELREFLQRLPEVIRDFAEAVRNLVEER